MLKLSTGKDSTLGNHREIAAAVFGEDSPAVKFLDEQISKSPNGVDEEVVMPESQVVHLLGNIHFQKKNGQPRGTS